MHTIEVARSLAQDQRVQSVGSSFNPLYRVWTQSGTKLIKVYSSPAAAERERATLASLHGLSGLPWIVESGHEGDQHWHAFPDAGRWNLAALADKPSLAGRAGEILTALHAIGGELTPLHRAIDAAWIRTDFAATFRRLQHYRGRLRLAAGLLEQATALPPPFAGSPRLAHTDPRPEHFLVDDEGRVTLMHWEWSTLAPPEWDFTKTRWLLGLVAGPGSQAGFDAGYGRDSDPLQIELWTAYHAGMLLLQSVEARDQQLRGTDFLVKELARAVGAATG